MARLIAKVISLLVLIALMVPPCLFFVDKMSLDQIKNIMFILTIIWFITASIWMRTNDPAS